MIKNACGESLEELKALWKEAFGDGDEFIDFYFRAYFDAKAMLVYTEDGKPLSMLTLIDGRLRGQDVRYIYAVATAKSARGRGLSTRLLDYACDTLPDGVSGVFLVPADESLFRFYGARGFDTAFYIKTAVVKPSERLCRFRSIGAEEYGAVRSRIFGGSCLKWSGKHIEYALAENARAGGFCIAGDGSNGEFVCFGYRDGGALVIRELVSKSLADASLAAGCLGGANEVRVRGFWDEAEGDLVPFGMWRGAQGQPLAPAYLNIVLD